MAKKSPEGDWSQNLENVPIITQKSVDKWADEVARIPKSKQTKGYSNFIEGYIHDVEVQENEKKVWIRARAYPSMRKNEEPYKLMVTIVKESSSDQAYTISSSDCECKAGSGNCSHSIGLLYLISHYKKLGLSAVPPIQSKTSLPQTWHIPSRRKGLEPKCVDGLQINEVKPQQPPKKKRRIIEGILPNVYCPVEKPIPGNFTQTLIQELKAISSDAQILQILPTTQQQTVQSTFGPVAYGSPLSYQQKPSDEATDIINHPDAVFPDFLLPQLTCTYTTVLNKCESNKYMGLQITKETSCDVEKQTQQQSHNKVWHDVRKNRITSSVFKDVCSRRGDFEVLALRLLKTKNIMTAQMKFGIENEPVAAKAYCDITGNSVYLSGFVVNPSLPHLGTSPDRKVFDPQADPQFGLLEIK